MFDTKIKKMKNYYIASIAIIGLLIIIGFYFFNGSNTKSSSRTFDSISDGINGSATNLQKERPLPTSGTQANARGGKTYSTQDNNFWGYEFYTSNVDKSGNIDIGSNSKQKIAHLLNALKYPKSLTKKLIIINLDPTIVGENDAIQVPWTGRPALLLSATTMEDSGSFSKIGEGAVIFLNYSSNYDDATLTHELGHYIGAQLTDAEWGKFYKLRNIASGTPKMSNTWEQSPTEDFAEVYKATYSQGLRFDPAWQVHTTKSSVDEKTKVFVRGVLARLIQ